jgi:hypothetical protein
MSPALSVGLPRFSRTEHCFCFGGIVIKSLFAMLSLKKASLLLWLVIPAALHAQAIGGGAYGARVFSTGFPASISDEYFENGSPKMSKERRETALEH